MAVGWIACADDVPELDAVFDPYGACAIDADGVWTYRNVRPAEELPRTIATHLVTVGGLGDDTGEPLESVQAGLLLGSGRFVVLSGWERLLFYTGDGRQAKVVGRDGDGPGEFRQATRLGLRENGDFWVWDLLLQRLSEFSSTGELLDSRAVTHPELPPPQAFGLLDDGSVVASRTRVIRQEDRRRRGVWRNTIRYMRQTTDGDWSHVTDAPGLEMYSVDVGSRTSPERLLFGATTKGTVNGDLLYLVDTAEPSIIGMRGDGTVVTRVHLGLESGQIPGEIEEKERQRRTERYEYLRRSPQLSQVYELWRQRAQVVPTRDVLPPIRSIGGGARDELWVQLEQGDEVRSRRWLILRPYEGTVRLVRLPDGHRLLHAANSSVLTSSVGELGEYYVSVFELDEPVVPRGRDCRSLSAAGGRPNERH
jgi:hypothetical protein